MGHVEPETSKRTLHSSLNCMQNAFISATYYTSVQVSWDAPQTDANFKSVNYQEIVILYFSTAYLFLAMFYERFP